MSGQLCSNGKTANYLGLMKTFEVVNWIYKLLGRNLFTYKVKCTLGYIIAFKVDPNSPNNKKKSIDEKL